VDLSGNNKGGGLWRVLKGGGKCSEVDIILAGGPPQSHYSIGPVNRGTQNGEKK